MDKKLQKILFPLLLGTSLLVSGCDGNSDSATEDEDGVVINLVEYEDSDYYTDWQADNFTFIHLEGTTATVDGDGGAVVEDSQILIRTSGTYVLDGTLTDGQIVVDSEDTGNVRLVLNGVTIHSTTSAPIDVKQADKTIVSLEKGTENVLSDATEYVYENNTTDEPTATIFSKDDLTINGTGALTVQGNFNDAIKSNDDLKITGGTIQVTSTDDGIVGRDVLAVKDAAITVTAGGDGLKASNDEEESKGNVILEDGSFTIKADGDGIQAEQIVAIVDGEYTITAGGGSPETITNQEAGMGMGGGMERGGGGPTNFNSADIASYIDRLLDGIDVSDELKEKLEAAETMEEVQTILQDNPEVLEQIQENGNMRSPGGMNGTPPEGMEEGANFTPPSDGQGFQPPDNGGDSENGQPSEAQGNMSEASDEQTTEEETVSTKGIKAGAELYVAGGTIIIDSLDDALHSNQDVTISGGEIMITTGDDGIHGDADVLLNGGEVSIEKSLEGIEGVNITFAGGTYHVHAEDDGVNANGGSDEFGMTAPPTENQDTAAATSQPEEETAEEGLLLIEDGYLVVDANGDGLDSNTSIKMTGGTAIVYGPTDNGNGPLDYGNTFDIEGGILVASGSSGMAQGVSEESSQNAIMMTFSEYQEANTSVYVTDENGEEIFAITPEKEFQTIVISTPDLKLNQNYTLHSGGVLTGENSDGVYHEASYEEGELTVEFTMSSVMTYLDENGVTEGNSQGMMNGNPFGQGGSNPFGTTEENEQGSEN
ncbi:carbohydrate-binding domain-containing protein [Caldibacillus lycopersici]|uniref:Carbohydrate-binding domain-containing protein n=1 Tax=Perspicuibacillus lycopersici TaxID=1325689 RepID=A0AAE3IRJ4_9BACI|nr:carbohydrate-binding domain-containing protein [Perspicuibacillus lycopersici]MCU9613141.1 carbohydrate-binding domain-containing protein [Perspicuibacillus lycopersici]